jgi:outer membrane protein OmpA-like peptidoglycan-associated protein
MKKIHLLFFSICFNFICNGQINLIGHTMINNSPLDHVHIFIKVGGVVTKTLSTQSKSQFKLELDYGKIYDIYFYHPKSPVMYLEVLANTVPREKYDFLMGYELNIPLVYKTDDDIDTTVFKNPFFKIIFNGNKHMVDDTTYNNAFARTVIKKPAKETKAEPVKEEGKQVKDSVHNVAKNPELPGIIAGKVFLNGNPRLTVRNKPITVLNKNGEIIRSTYTNRFGAFYFTGVKASDISRFRMEIKDAGGDNSLTLVTSKNASIIGSKPMNGTCEWEMNPEQVSKLVDNNFTTNIGGKLVSSTSKEKKFYAKKDVYLCNKYNTVIKKTTTNLFGTFVFEDIKPDNFYFICIDGAKVIPGERVDMLSKDDNFIGSLDSIVGGRQSMKIASNYNKVFNDISVDEDEIKMDVKATIYGDNINTPIGKLKIILLNDSYQVIDSAVTDNFGTFKFKYLPFLKRFYLSAENTDNILDVFKDIIIYSNDDNLIKIMTHQKGTKFSYKPVNAEMSSLRDVELEDPWLELINTSTATPAEKRNVNAPAKSIVENILFETGKYDITPQAREILDKIILVLNTNKQLKIEVGAHTDSKGSDVSNLKLSQLRAKTVQDYIAHSGIDVKRIISKGYGESKLLNNCRDNVPCSEIEHAQNRRIEFKILGE